MILRTLLEDPETMEAPVYDLSSQHSCISSILQRNRQTLEKTLQILHFHFHYKHTVYSEEKVTAVSGGTFDRQATVASHHRVAH